MREGIAGFTLIELLVCFAILSIVMGFGYSLVPAFLEKNHLDSRVDEVKAAIAYARMHALSSGETLMLSPLLKGGDWSLGMVLSSDNPTHPLLHEWRWKGISMVWHGFQSRNHLRFSSRLRLNAVNGTFILSNVMNQRRVLVVNRLGRVKTS